MNDIGVIYKVTIHYSQKVELARGKWKDVKFICLESSFIKVGKIKEAIYEVYTQKDHGNDLGRVKELIEDGHLIEGRQKYLEDNLHIAVHSQCYAIVELLVSSGFDVNRVRRRQIMKGFGPFATSSWVEGERAIHIAV